MSKWNCLYGKRVKELCEQLNKHGVKDAQFVSAGANERTVAIWYGEPIEKMEAPKPEPEAKAEEKKPEPEAKPEPAKGPAKPQ